MKGVALQVMDGAIKAGLVWHHGMKASSTRIAANASGGGVAAAAGAKQDTCAGGAAARSTASQSQLCNDSTAQSASACCCLVGDRRIALASSWLPRREAPGLARIPDVAMAMPYGLMAAV